MGCKPHSIQHCHATFLLLMAVDERFGKEQIILLVEDDPEDAEIIRIASERLDSLHCRVIPINDGRQAMHYLAGIGQYGNRNEFPFPTLILLDLTLPQMNGFDFLAWLHGETGKMPPVAVLSYSRLESDKHLAKKLGAKEYCVKSADLNETVVMLKNLINAAWLSPPPEGTGLQG